jgi:hypothetical protein
LASLLIWSRSPSPPAPLRFGTRASGAPLRSAGWSGNISDVTLLRASRVTPAVTAAQASLADAVTARDRECKGGVGKFCREREATVTERTQAVTVAMQAVERTADPQTEAASHIVAWLTFGVIHPSGDDFAMLRLILLALLPQVGGILLMLCRRSV